MSQTKKGNQWYFGMKTHIGVDAEGGIIYTVECMTDKVADNTLLKNCLHGNKSIIFSGRLDTVSRIAAGVEDWLGRRHDVLDRRR